MTVFMVLMSNKLWKFHITHNMAFIKKDVNCNTFNTGVKNWLTCFECSFLYNINKPHK